jgi:hypothetical protein
VLKPLGAATQIRPTQHSSLDRARARRLPQSSKTTSRRTGPCRSRPSCSRSGRRRSSAPSGSYGTGVSRLENALVSSACVCEKNEMNSLSSEASPS